MPHIRLRNPPLAGDAFVNQGFAVGGEGGDLGFDDSNDAFHFTKFLFKLCTDRLLFSNFLLRNWEFTDFCRIRAGGIR